MKIDDLTYEWRLLADLYALAIQMDRTRDSLERRTGLELPAPPQPGSVDEA